MNTKTRLLSIALVIFLLFTIATVVLADDGEMFRRNISKTPDGETEKAAIASMPFYVPAQAADGELLGTLEYVFGEDDPETPENEAESVYREYARPLVTVFIDGIEHEEDLIRSNITSAQTRGGASFGTRDAFAAVSLDDGASWKVTNLSKVADQSSFTLKNGMEYPGDAYRMSFAIADNRILAVWMSRYCMGGEPAYTWEEEVVDPETGQTIIVPMYEDLFGVAGSQKSVDYTLQGFPEVGEVPYGCVWTARGILESVETETAEGTVTTFEVQWRKPERLTSGRRDPNVEAAAGAVDAGFVVIWQEDPDGLAPGQGLGPGEGWAGSIVNQKTDLWFSQISWEDFDDYVIVDTEEEDDSLPKVAVPLSVPVRLTDNNICKADSTELYCTAQFEDLDDPEEDYSELYDSVNLCDKTDIWTKPDGNTMEVCKTNDERLLTGQTGASRVRMSLFPYSTTSGEGEDEVTTTSAWVVMAYEESKGLGYIVDEEDVPIEIGKNIKYQTFDMFRPKVVYQGDQLNQPEVPPGTVLLEGETWSDYFVTVPDVEPAIYQTEIARRFAMIAQSAAKAEESASRTVLFALFKQGILNQGGPADILARRFVLPEGFDHTAGENPYAFENIVCGEPGDEKWEYPMITITSDTGEQTEVPNPNYPNGLCLDTPINLSSPSIISCDGAEGDCAADFPWDGGATYPQVDEWFFTLDDMDDLTWENPYDVAKGHRGFLDGDFLMVMYAWSPNWRANSVGHDKYNLYVRRSFDGGQTWTTTPADKIDFDELDVAQEDYETCFSENYLTGSDPKVPDSKEYCYEASDYGLFEQARNVSQLIGTRVTVLDPRYTPTLSALVKPDGFDGPFFYPEDFEEGSEEIADSQRRDSYYFIVYETGDNTTVAEGEATPMDLFYSRASVYGDFYDWVLFDDPNTEDEIETDLRWDWLENQKDELSSEASVTTNPAGNFLYAVWNQWNEFEEDVITNSDAWFRRVAYNEVIELRGVSEIVYCSHATAGHNEGVDLEFVGYARDYDHIGEGIVAYEWTSSIDGLLSTEVSFSIPVTDLSLGIHTITFRALDGEGDWTTPESVSLWVAEAMYRLNLPLFEKE